MRRHKAARFGMGEAKKSSRSFSSTGILWDYDGVLVRSEEVKWRTAWERACAGEDRALLCAIRGVLATAEGRQLSRTALLDAALAVAREQGVMVRASREALLARFGEEVRHGVVAAGLVEGALEVLDALNNAGVVQYLISGTAQEDLDYTTAALGVAPRMCAVYGGRGEDKITHAKKAMAAHPSVTQWFAVGDQPADVRLAEAAGVSFIGVATEVNGWGEERVPPFPVVRALSEIPGLVCGSVASR